MVAEVASRALTPREIAERVRPVAQRYGLREVYLFGSAARGQMRDDSDVDLIYALGDGPRTYRMAQDIQSDLTDALGRKVDALRKETLIDAASRSRASRLFLDALAPDLIRLV